MNIIILVISILINNAPVDSKWDTQNIFYSVGNQTQGTEYHLSIWKKAEWSKCSWTASITVSSEQDNIWLGYNLDSYEDCSYNISTGNRG